MIIDDATLLRRMHHEDHKLQVDERMWTFPNFEHEITPNHDGANLIEITDALPDPNDFCVGVYFTHDTEYDNERSRSSGQAKTQDPEMLFYLDARID